MAKKNLILILMAFAIGILCGFYFSTFINKTDTNLFKTDFKREEGFTYISPLIDCEYESPITEKKAKRIKEAVASLINTQIASNEANRVSVYYRDLKNGPWFGINEDAKFTPASLLKVPVMLALYKEADSNPSILYGGIEIEDYDLGEDMALETIQLPDEYQPLEKLELGQVYPVMDLIYRMIAYSDNQAFYALLAYTPIEGLQRVHNDLGLVFPDDTTPEDYVSVKAYASLFRILYNASYLSKDFSSEALAIMAATTYDKGLYSGLPSNIKLANKFGVHQTKDPKNPIQLHDCGIIYMPENPYILCVMTQGNELSTLEETISLISKIVYTQMQND